MNTNLTEVVITDRVLWYERITWLAENSAEMVDRTDWAAWQLGLTDAIFLVDDHSAIMYYLTWKP